MQSVGQRLYAERQKQHRELSDIAVETCISTRYLQAIEADDLKALPGGFFSKSFVKQYADALGIDFGTLQGEVDRLIPQDDIDLLPVLSANYQAAKIANPSSFVSRNRTSVCVALLVVVLAGSSSLYALWERTQRQKASELERATTPQAAPVATTPVADPKPAIAEPAPPPAASTPAASTTELQRSDIGKLTVALEATEKTWVKLTSDGKTIFSGMLAASQTKAIEGVLQAQLTTGNAAGLDVRWNGKSIGPIGGRGQTRVVVFTPENFHILAPRRM
jgi:cytoskeletal protein RodZ